MSEIECAQLYSELFRRRHSTRQSHGLFALAKPLLDLPVNQSNKFDVSNFTHFRDTEGSQNYKSRSRDVGHAPFDLLLHFWLRA